jgi:hypothetical protein
MKMDIQRKLACFAALVKRGSEFLKAEKYNSLRQ